MPHPTYTSAQLDGGQIDTFCQLALLHPEGVEAGDISSKAGRSGLIERELARYEADGMTYLTMEGEWLSANNPPELGTRAYAALVRKGEIPA
jgi:hypothetical protein